MTASNSPPPGPESKFVTQIVNAVIRITPVGGSGWILVHFLRQQEWIYAVLMFPVMLITGAWAAYTGNFISTSNESAGELGKRHSQSFSNWLGNGSG
ncbi:hypothetical protein [Leptothoe spongobia]|uniref:Uncharacterized protein n=1 Tax=Leptothoe spongobia TAU-MAC 1115 TaxID=1967444 RepID=A0A947DFY5_9CYAN|nr:hypothetical protein [Leptothoe spongobia]MBT9315201.1 hypothetical protein [Leptothoe spongobia TAU-MAC 1115]